MEIAEFRFPPFFFYKRSVELDSRSLAYVGFSVFLFLLKFHSLGIYTMVSVNTGI